jgi:hypothetical protein
MNVHNVRTDDDFPRRLVDVVGREIAMTGEIQHFQRRIAGEAMRR